VPASLVASRGGVLMPWKRKPRGTRVIDRFAEELSIVGDVPTAAANLGLNRDYANSLFSLIRKQLGEQAR
jgi:hypothetical protein